MMQFLYNVLAQDNEMLNLQAPTLTEQCPSDEPKVNRSSESHEQHALGVHVMHLQAHEVLKYVQPT